jgi:hypothetical protein
MQAAQILFLVQSVMGQWLQLSLTCAAIFSGFTNGQQDSVCGPGGTSIPGGGAGCECHDGFLGERCEIAGAVHPAVLCDLPAQQPDNFTEFITLPHATKLLTRCPPRAAGALKRRVLGVPMLHQLQGSKNQSSLWVILGAV